MNKAKGWRWRLVLCSILAVPLFIMAGFSSVFYDHGAKSVYAGED